MFRLVWLFLVCCLALCLELELAYFGLLFPAALFTAFYLGLAFRLGTGVVSGLLVALVAEILLARRATLVPLFVPLWAFLWVFGRWGDRLSLLNQALAGLGLAWAHAGYYVVAENLYFRAGWCLLSGPHALALFLKAGLVGALLTPLLIAGLDWVADRTGVRSFAYGTGGSV
jgi:hypothetical protein